MKLVMGVDGTGRRLKVGPVNSRRLLLFFALKAAAQHLSLSRGERSDEGTLKRGKSPPSSPPDHQRCGRKITWDFEARVILRRLKIGCRRDKNVTEVQESKANEGWC